MTGKLNLGEGTKMIYRVSINRLLIFLDHVFSGDMKISSDNDQLMTVSANVNESPKQNSVFDDSKCQKQQPAENPNGDKISKIFLLAVSGQSVHALSYNWHNTDDQTVAIRRLSRWLEWRHSVFTLSVYQKLGLTNPLINSRFAVTGHLSRINNLDLLLDYKNYVSVVGKHEPSNNKIRNEKNSRFSSRGKPTDNNETDDKKTKPVQYDKDFQDLYIERLVRRGKQQRRTGENCILLAIENAYNSYGKYILVIVNH